MRAAGDFTGDDDLYVTCQIDDVSGGAEVGSATFRWKTSETASGWEASGVTTATTLTSLGTDGKQVAWEQGTGDDFVEEDSWIFPCYALYGPARLLDLSRNSVWRSGSLTTNLISNPNFTSDTTDWSAVNCTLASVAGGQSGNCLEITRTGGAYQYTGQSIACTSGNAYICKAYVKSGTSGNEGFQVQAFGGAEVGTETGTTSGDWVQYEFTFIADQASISINLIKDSATAGTMLFDTIEVYEIPTLTIDLGSAQNITALVALDHNWSASATCQLFANSSDAWASPAYTKALTETDEPCIEYISESYRYWRLEMRDETNTDDYIELSNFYLGTYLELAQDASRLPRSNNRSIRHHTVRNTAITGDVRGRVYSRQRVFPTQFQYLDNTDYESLETMYLALYDVDTGDIDPCFVHRHYDTPSECYLMNNANDTLQRALKHYDLDECTLEWAEVVKGRL
jgi:hypothetical protein